MLERRRLLRPHDPPHTSVRPLAIHGSPVRPRLPRLLPSNPARDHGTLILMSPGFALQLLVLQRGQHHQGRHHQPDGVLSRVAGTASRIDRDPDVGVTRRPGPARRVVALDLTGPPEGHAQQSAEHEPKSG